MFHLVRPADFFRELSRNPRLKLDLAWLTLVGLVVPTASLMSIGLAERLALPLMLVAILPFQYFVFCILQWFKDISPYGEAHGEHPEADAAFGPLIPLLLLDFLRRKGVGRVAESELHRLFFEVNSLLPVPMKFIQRPTTYSDQLFQCLKKLERDHLVDELVYVHDGWVPKHLYQVTKVGYLKAAEVEEHIRTFRTLPIEQLFRSLGSAAKRGHLLPSFTE